MNIFKIFNKLKNKMPDEYIVPNPYNIPVHNQGNKKNCTSHAFAAMLEYRLSEKLKERTLVDVDDLWKKQKKYGTATEKSGDFIGGPFMIATKYGIRFKTDSGKMGTLFLSGKKRKEGILTIYEGYKIELD
jgi:hypothetical protein